MKKDAHKLLHCKLPLALSLVKVQCCISSSAVFGENLKYCYSLGVVVVYVVDGVVVVVVVYVVDGVVVVVVQKL